MKEAFAQIWQYVVGSVVPASGAAPMSAEEQPKKQYIIRDDSNDAHTSVKPVRHSPGTEQQSLSDLQVCVQ